MMEASVLSAMVSAHTNQTKVGKTDIYGHACIFSSFLVGNRYIFFSQNTPNGFLDLKHIFPTLLTPWSESTLQLPSIISELF